MLKINNRKKPVIEFTFIIYIPMAYMKILRYGFGGGKVVNNLCKSTEIIKNFEKTCKYYLLLCISIL
jgi:hypothetical protein